MIKRILLALGIFSVITIVLYYIGSNDLLSWSTWKLAGGYPNIFCELVRGSGINQPSNAWSSLAFVLYSLFIILNIPPKCWIICNKYKTLYAFSLFCLGLGSWLFHASVTWAGHFCDATSMYMVGAFLFSFSLFRTNFKKFLLLYLIISIGFPLLQWHGIARCRNAFAFLIVSSFLIEVFKYGALINKNFIFSVFCLVSAFIIWYFDKERIFCDPPSIFQGHALWHILTSTSIYFAYLYYLSHKKNYNPATKKS